MAGDTVLAWVLVVVSALSTIAGAGLVLIKLKKEHEQKFIACSLAASSGIMLYLCLAELFSKSVDNFLEAGYVADGEAYRYTTLSFFSGLLFFYFVMLAAHFFRPGQAAEPDMQSPTASVVEGNDAGVDPADVQPKIPEPLAASAEHTTDSKIYQMGMKAALAVSLHNIPEGLAGWIATYADGRSGMNICFGLILHNIPEGLCIAAPVYHATRSRCKAFAWAAVAALAEFAGGVIAAVMVAASGTQEPQTLYGVLFGFVDGLVVAVVVLEFIPHVVELDPKGLLWPPSFILGAAVIAATLLTEGL
eukprot:TRINITY_DN3600_c0_g1_i4.p1 TRINITY_DN3600_c0_g1~~TRINITY_DN3600_c0_g1_i4.p1  ORF type:complete len:305 (+),score=59.03 TRINITY_DN3600_c0_g1_i4:58-972(+)